MYPNNGDNKNEMNYDAVYHQYMLQDDNFNPTLNYQSSPEPSPQPPRQHPKKRPGVPVAVMVACCVLCSTVAGVGGGFLGGYYAGNNSSSGNLPSPPSVTATNTGSKTALTISQIAAMVSNSVVEIRTEQVVNGNMMSQYITEGAGSGVIYTEDGYIITNNHVIEDASNIKVTLHDGTEYTAKLVGTDAKTDIAVLKIDATGLSAVTLGDSGALSVGDFALAVGNPLGQLGGTVTDGIISALDRDVTIDGETMKLMQTNAAVNPGNSGGGLFNAYGELIGVVNAKSSGNDVEGLGFAIPSNTAKSVADDLINKGYVGGRVSLGVSLLDISNNQSMMMYRVDQQGVYVVEVTEGSDAQRAGLQPGDCIISANDTEVSSAAEVKSILNTCGVGDTLKLKVLREGKEVTVTVELTESVPQTKAV